MDASNNNSEPKPEETKCQPQQAQSANYVILDCDGGSDDAWALLLLLKAEEEKRLIVLGVTICGGGNTSLHNAARNMLRVMKSCGRDEIPIFLGAAEALLPKTDRDASIHLFHGANGFGDVFANDPEVDIEDMVEGEHAVTALHEFCCIEHPKKVTLIATGPLTNIAICQSMYGAQFSDNVKEIYIMGGNHLGIGNCTRSAEFNFYADPEAAHIVLSKSRCPMTILPWETCMHERFFIDLRWRLKDFGPAAATKSAAVQLLNIVEDATYTKQGFTAWNPCDALLVAAFLFGSRFVRKESRWHATVDLRGCHTRGQMVLDHLQEENKNPKNVRLIELVDAEMFRSIVQWSVGLLGGDKLWQDTTSKKCEKATADDAVICIS